LKSTSNCLLGSDENRKELKFSGEEFGLLKGPLMRSNSSREVLQLFELSQLCDGVSNCFHGSDENRKELKCSG